MTTTLTLDPDEERLVSYFASRVVMSFGDAQALRSSIANRYSFEDIRLTYFVQELLRRTGIASSNQLPIKTSYYEFTEQQHEFLRRAVAYISPESDLGPAKPVNPETRIAQSSQHFQDSTEQKLLIHCYSCKSAEGKPKKIYRSRYAAEHAAHEAGRIFRKLYDSYGCPVRPDWWHLRTMKPQVLVTKVPPPPAPIDAAKEAVQAPALPKIHEWTPEASPQPFELNLREVTARALLESTAELNQRVQQFLITKLQAEILRTTYRWIHVEALESVIDAKTAVIYSPDYVLVKPDRIQLIFVNAELHISNKYISWR